MGSGATAFRLKPFTPQRYRRRIFSQIWMLALQFVLGMLLNLIGEEATGAKHATYIVLLVVHILNAIGLVEGGFYIGWRAPGKLAWWATGTLSAALVAGILTVRTGQDIWSFIMASGFLASAWLYGAMYVQADHVYKAMDATLE